MSWGGRRRNGGWPCPAPHDVWKMGTISLMGTTISLLLALRRCDFSKNITRYEGPLDSDSAFA